MVGLNKKRLLAYLGCRFLRIGVTLGPYSDEMFAYQAKVSKLYHTILARDHKTMDELEKFNFHNFDYIPDLAWAYSRDLSSNGHQHLFDSFSKKFAVLSFRDCIEGSVRDSDYFSSMLKSLKKVFSHFKDYKFVLTYQVEYDKAVCEEIQREFASLYDIEFHDGLLSVEEAFHIYSNAEFVLSNRMHVLMLAVKANTLPIALTNTSEHFKLVSIFKDENMEDCLFDIEGLETDTLQNTVQDKCNLMPRFEKIIKKNASSVKQKIADIF